MSMVAAKCTNCGANIKVDKNKDAGICEYCGTAFITEKAINEYNISITNNNTFIGANVTLKDGDIKNYLQLAQNALDNSNNEEACNYANKIIECEGNNSQAWYIKGCSTAWMTTLANLRIEESISCFEKAYEYAKEKDKIKDEICSTLVKVVHSLIALAGEHFAEFASNDTVRVLLKCWDQSLFVKANMIATYEYKWDDFDTEIVSVVNSSCIEAWNRIINDYNNSYPRTSTELIDTLGAVDLILRVLETSVNIDGISDEMKVTIYKNMIDIQKKTIDFNYQNYNSSYGNYISAGLSSSNRTARIDKIMEWHQKIKDIQPEYVIPNRATLSKGCYIATCVYGSYNCPEVWVLRRYRDECLDKTILGKVFIKIYYSISPIMVKYLGKYKVFTNTWKSILDSIVRRLRTNGYMDTPYDDKY